MSPLPFCEYHQRNWWDHTIRESCELAPMPDIRLNTDKLP